MTTFPYRTLVRATVAAALAAGGSGLALLAQMPGSLGVSPVLTKYVDALPVPPAATSRYLLGVSEFADYYEIAMTQHKHQFHSELGQATVWTYGMKGQPGVYLGPTIVATKGRPVVVKWFNQLPNTPDAFPLKDSVDPTIMGAELPPGRAIPHLHGGKTASRYDGLPDQWWTSNGQKGPGFVTDTFTYTNDQPAALLWYHDHAMGATRFNPYLGLAAAYLIFDPIDTGTTINGQRVPSGDYHLPIVLQDKVFNPDGTLYYPTQGNNAVHPIWVPECFGDTPVINGKAFPRLSAEPRRYRLRLLNGSQARFYNLSFDHNGTALAFHVIGSEQGLLPAPVKKQELLIAPGERFDVIVDFTGLPQGTRITVKNNAPAPYPGGGMPDLPELMQIAVTKPLLGQDLSVPAAHLNLPAVPRLVQTPGLSHREIVGEETEDPTTGTPVVMKFNGYASMDPTTDFIKVGSTETWEWINLTCDAHPMHIHLVASQVVNRQAFDVDAYKTAWDAYLVGGRLPHQKPVLAKYLQGPLLPPSPEEMGAKDTVKAYPGFVTRVRATFNLPWTSALDMNMKTRSFGSYVYHCHILEHEENDMMRPFEIKF
jgi:spore coat protein A